MKTELNIFFCLNLMFCLFPIDINGQNINREFKTLTNEVNEIFLTPYVHGILLSPYEILQHNRNRTIRNIEMVETILFTSKYDTIPILIKNNKTIIHKPDEKYNSRTFNYYKDGRIKKVLKGIHLDDQFIYDDNGFLIGHGHGGEQKRATRSGKDFEWYNVTKNEFEYSTSYNEQDKLKKFKSAGQNMVEFKIENYTWDEGKLESQNEITQYKGGGADTTFIRIAYDTLGLVNAILSREDNQEHWSIMNLKSKIEELESKNIKITISKDDHKLLAITYDKFDNWIELNRPNGDIRRTIKYRKKKRRR